MSSTKEKDSSSVSFVCQRCMMPIKIDPSFNSLDEHTLAELHLPLYAPPPLDLDENGETSGLLDKFVPGIKLSTSGTSVADSESLTQSQGFTIVGTSSEMSAQQSNLFKIQMQLYDILSNNTEIDHPLCDECCDILITILDDELRETEEESNQFQAYLKKLENEPDDSEDVDALEEQLKEVKREEAKLRGELNELKVEEATALENLKREKQEHTRLKEQEEIFFKEYCKYKKQINDIDDYKLTLDYELKYVEGQLASLERTNALNATFHIWHNGHFGTINTFRLGRLPSEPVDWNEINAAWGQTALLLNSIARRIKFKFQTYQIVPFGNHSYIKVLADNTELPLHGSGGFRFLWDTKFDQGMTAFLECLSQLQEEMIKRGGKNPFELPYTVSEKGKIQDNRERKSYSIKIQLNSEENWTKALKFMLTDLKWALTWVSSQTAAEPLEQGTS